MSGVSYRISEEEFDNVVAIGVIDADVVEARSSGGEGSGGSGSESLVGGQVEFEVDGEGLGDAEREAAGSAAELGGGDGVIDAHHELLVQLRYRRPRRCVH